MPRIISPKIGDLYQHMEYLTKIGSKLWSVQAEKEQQGLGRNNDLCLGHQKTGLCLYTWCDLDLDHDILSHDSWEPE